MIGVFDVNRGQLYHEFFTLAYLAQRPGWIFSKEQIYEEVWKESVTNCGASVTNVVS